MQFFNSYIESCSRLFDFFDQEPNALFSGKNSAQLLEMRRVDAFRIQSFGRIFKLSKKNKEHPISQCGLSLRLQSKLIEDQIGQYLYHWEMVEKLKSSEDLELLGLGKIQLKRESQKIEKNWSKFRDSVNILLDNFGILERDRDLLQDLYAKGFRRELKKIHTFISEELDSQLLEDGTHELRRKLRWAVMGIIYPLGLFRYEALKEGMTPNKYTKLSPESSINAIEVPFKSVDLLSEWVGKLGQVKDKGLFEYYKETLRGISAADHNRSSPSIVSMTEFCRSEILEKEPLLIIRKALKSTG